MSFIFNKQTNIAANKSTSNRIPSKKSHVNATFLKSYPQDFVILNEVKKMKYFLYLIIFMLGACIISFLKVVAHDYPHLSLTRRSHCDYCDRILRWFEIIPIIGYFIVYGKCSHCKNQISFLNPVNEFIGGSIFLTLINCNDFALIPLFLLLILLGFCDAFFGYVYPMTYVIVIPTLFWHQFHPLIGLIFYFSLLLFSRKYEFGLGDIEVIALLGLILGWFSTLWIITLACLICLTAYLVHKKRSFRFIPYLSYSTGIVYLISLFIA